MLTADRIGHFHLVCFGSDHLKKYLDGLTPGAALSAVGVESGFFLRVAQITYCGALD
jgi:hypothetical protein